MGWSLGFDDDWGRDVGYGVPAICDHPSCNEKIDRGLRSVCGYLPYGGDRGCGLFFCIDHLSYTNLCERCEEGGDPFEAKPDTQEWVNHKLNDESWQQWREENPDAVKKLSEAVTP